MYPTSVSAGSSISHEMLEKFRRTGLRLDSEGRFWHEGAIVTHPRIRLALLRWLDTLDDGRTVLRFDDARYAYIEVEDAHLIASSAAWRNGGVWLALNDGCQEELAYGSLQVCASGRVYCAVRQGRLRARLSPDAAASLAEEIHECDEGLCLRAKGQAFVVAEIEEGAAMKFHSSPKG